MLVASPTESGAAANPEPAVAKELLGKALGRIASGVFVVTYSHQGTDEGMLATFVAQVGFEPPAVTVSINKQRAFLDNVTVGAIITVNILSNQSMDVFKAFARPAKGDEDRFAGLEVVSNPAGGPAFAKAVSFLNCKVTQLIDVGDHVLAVAEVVSGQPLNPEAEPMVHLRKNGFQY